MRHTRRFLSIAVLSLFVLFPVTAFLCGTERWPVKVCKDAKAKVLFQNNDISTHQLQPSVTTTIKALRAFPVPGPLGVSTPRFNAKAETTIWTIDGTLFDYKQEAGAHGDTDYHLAIKDSGGRTMIAEIPKPTCLTNTPEPLKSMITQARADFDSHFTVTGSFKAARQKVRITGPGMFDKIHGQKGVAPNGIEIHPVIKIEFLP
jgi:hypothetical protein